MHYLMDSSYKLWLWLLEGNGSRATAILVFITGVYAFLTWRMARAIAQQTRATVQPVVLLDFHWQNEKYFPVSYFEIKNVGTQPLLLLDIKLWCGCAMHGKSYTQHYTLWDEHILPPGESLQPKFDFRRDIEADKLAWSPGCLSYSLEVVASDLSKQVVLSYTNMPVLSIVNVTGGMPLSVRWRYFQKPFVSRYYRLLYRFNRVGSEKTKASEPDAERKADRSAHG